MKMRNQLEDGYPKLLRIEPADENKQHHSSQNKPQDAFGGRVSPRGWLPQQGNSYGFGNAAPRPFASEQQHGTNRGAVRYNYNSGQSAPAATYSGQSSNRYKSSSQTGNNVNVYLGGRTSSFGPAGCSAIQKQYSFGSYTAGMPGNEIDKL